MSVLCIVCSQPSLPVLAVGWDDMSPISHPGRPPVGHWHDLWHLYVTRGLFTSCVDVLLPVPAGFFREPDARSPKSVAITPSVDGLIRGSSGNFGSSVIRVDRNGGSDNRTAAMQFDMPPEITNTDRVHKAVLHRASDCRERQPSHLCE